MADDPAGFAAVPLWMVRDSEIDQHMLLVFLALASHLGKHDVVWPGQDTIAAEARLGLTSVKEALVRLRDAGLVRWRRRPTGAGYVNEYQILINPISRDSRVAAPPGEGQPPGGEGTAAQRLQEQPPSGYEVDPVEVDPVKNPSSSDVEEPAVSSATADGKKLTEQAIDMAFERWWAKAPRKVGKRAARKAYEKALKLVGADALMAGLEAHLPYWEGKTQEHIPHPTTWLNEGRWEDRPEVPVEEKGDAPAEDPTAWMKRRA